MISLVNQFWSWSDISVLFDLICLDLLQGTIFRSKQDIQPLFKTISLAVNQDQSRPNETDIDYRISGCQDSVKIKICIFRTGKILWQVTDKMCLDPLRLETVCLFCSFEPFLSLDYFPLITRHDKYTVHYMHIIYLLPVHDSLIVYIEAFIIFLFH